MKSEIDVLMLYESNQDFKNYVDKLSNHYNEGRSITVLECLQLEIVRDYAKYLEGMK